MRINGAHELNDKNQLNLMFPFECETRSLRSRVLPFIVVRFCFFFFTLISYVFSMNQWTEQIVYAVEKISSFEMTNSKCSTRISNGSNDLSMRISSIDWAFLRKINIDASSVDAPGHRWISTILLASDGN